MLNKVVQGGTALNTLYKTRFPHMTTEQSLAFTTKELELFTNTCSNYKQLSKLIDEHRKVTYRKRMKLITVIYPIH